MFVIIRENSHTDTQVIGPYDTEADAQDDLVRYLEMDDKDGNQETETSVKEMFLGIEPLKHANTPADYGRQYAAHRNLMNGNH